MKLRSEAFLAVFVLALAAMLLVPLPTPVIDLLIVLNLAFSFLLLLTSLYLPNAVSLLTFPTLLLLSTLFRLALNVASSRLILADGDAGRVIEAFGSLLVGSQIAVGIIIFVIITIVNFLVIARGSSRVSEVAARFALDALPGKQAMIDNDLRAGLISASEATARRELLRKESQLYGAMDGSMKFVQGDAIAGFLIILANIGGGLSIALGNGMPLAEAFQTYTILTIGDGLVAQVPALLIAICAGIVVTRVSSGEKATLGEDVSSDLFSRPGVLLAAGGITMLLALLPGVPLIPFIVVGLLIAVTAFRIHSRRTLDPSLALASGGPLGSASIGARAGLPGALSGTSVGASGRVPPGSSSSAGAASRLLPPPGQILIGTSKDPGRAGESQFDLERISIRLDRHALFASYETSLPMFAEHWRAMTEILHHHLGVSLPEISFIADPTAPQGKITAHYRGVPLADVSVPLDCLVVTLEPAHARALGVDVELEVVDPLTGKLLSWIRTQEASELIAPFERFTGIDFALRAICFSLINHPASLVSVSATFRRLAELEQSDPGFFDANLDRRFINPARATQVLTRMIESGLSIGSIRQFVEELADYCATYARSELGPSDFDCEDIVRHIRRRRVGALILASPVCQAPPHVADPTGGSTTRKDYLVAGVQLSDAQRIRQWRTLFESNRHELVAQNDSDPLVREIRQAVRSGDRSIALICDEAELSAALDPARSLLPFTPLFSGQEITNASVQPVTLGRWSAELS